MRTLTELGVEVRPDMSYEELFKASEALAAQRQTVGFKADESGIYIESRIIKAALKENVNILYAGERWGDTRKGPKSFTAERVFINPERIYLQRAEADGVELFIGHTTGPKGPQSNLTYYEYATRPIVAFDVMVTRDALPLEYWPELWVQAQENGLGALRSQGFGRFDILAWDVVKAQPKRVKKAA